MKLLLIYCFLFLNIFVSAQTNLVPNPSFEDTTQCPPDGRLYYTSTWLNFGNTPDLNHSCSPISNSFSVPYNVFGYQSPQDGEAYADVYTFAIGGLYREFIGIPLLHQTFVGNSYHISFYVSPGSPGNGYCLQTDKIGARFSCHPFDSINLPPINNFAHVFSTNIISDTANWTEISGDVIADSSYNYLIIGNFFDDQNTDTSIIASDCYAFAVYYIDNCNVYDSTYENIIEPEKIHFSYSIKDEKIKFTGNISLIKYFELVDLSGRIIYCTPFQMNEFEISFLSAGIYFAILQSNTNKYLIKIIK
jgi:hypothetical protein